MWMLIREADGKESRLIVLCGSENILDWMKPVLPSAAQWDMGHLNSKNPTPTQSFALHWNTVITWCV